MAISTYAELQSAIGSNWLNRSDLSLRIPEFISLCEAELDRRLRSSSQIKRATTSATTQFVTLPDDFVELRNIQLDVDPVKRLQYVTIDAADDMRRSTYRSAGEPVFFTLMGTSVELLPTPSTSVTLQISYFRNIPKLSDSNTTNTILSAAPDVYLYGALRHAEPYLMNDERVSTWASFYERALQDLQLSEDRRMEYEGVMLMKPKNRLDYGQWR